MMNDVVRDLDETRRLMYGARVAGRTKRWELVGTLTNAIVHHSGVEANAHEVAAKLCRLVELGDVVYSMRDFELLVWADKLIDELSARIAAAEGYPPDATTVDG